MLPFRVDRREQHRTHQKNAAKPYLPHFPLATKLPSERKLTNLNRQIPDRLSDRLWRRDFSDVHARNMACLTQKNEPVLTKWAPTSNRFWVKNRCYTKQTTKPGLTGTRTRIRLSPNFTKTGQNFAAVESQNSELSLWNPLWNPLKKTGRLLPSDRPLLPGSAQNIENDVTYSKQTIGKFLPGATTHISDFTLSQNSVTAAWRTCAAESKAGASSRTPKERKPVRRDRSCPIERMARDARGCWRWKGLGSLRRVNRSHTHADQ